MDKHLLQEYEIPDDGASLYYAEVHFRTEDGPFGPDFVQKASGYGDTAEEAAGDTLFHARDLAKDEGRMTLLSLHIGRNRVKMLASPLLLEEVLAKEKEAADGNG